MTERTHMLDASAAIARQRAALKRIRRLDALICRMEDRYGAMSFTRRRISLEVAKEDAVLEHLRAGLQVVTALSEAGKPIFDPRDIVHAFTDEFPPMVFVDEWHALPPRYDA